MAPKDPGWVDVRITAKPSRLIRPIGLALRVARRLRIPPSAAFEDRLIRWLTDRSDVQLKEILKPDGEIS